MSQALHIQDQITPVSYDLFTRDFDAFTKALGDSYARWGFAVISDHGMPQDKVDAALEQMKLFFALPEETKLKYKLPVQGQRGYTPFGIETAKGATHSDLKEFWHVGRELPEGHAYRAVMADNIWPAEIPEFKPTYLELFSAFDKAGGRILEAIARHLKLAPDYFEATVRDGNSVLRLLHYPPVPKDGPHIRAGAHEDINVITLLLGAEEAGLEVKDHDGRWIAINPPPGSLVCNIGDMLQRLTNDVLPSTTHRVVNPPEARKGVARYSTPFFLHFNSDYLIQTLPGCVDAAHPDRNPEPITADDYLQERLREIKLA